MKIKVFVDWKNQKIYTERDYKEIVNAFAESIINNEEEFTDYLNSCYTPYEIWNSTSEERLEICSNWKFACYENAKDHYDYDKVEIEV